ncbi:MAG: isoprenylcysteine carboxylmethyltransferase family protein [Candidatus Micrarchaeaceae archaeon]|jgi:protein-S-isoprenylcysteine O-methyltransferase Ste14
MVSLGSTVIWPFIVFAVFWIITWPSSKRTAKNQSNIGWFTYWIFAVIGACLFLIPINVPALNITLIQSSFASHALGFLIEILGLCVAIWARITLGRNWSSRVTLKEKHELITKGPYKLVRHPIYTGMLTMFLGAAIYLGMLAAFFGLLFFFLSFWIKLKQEEKLMLKHFTKEYVKYKKKTKALIPFIY